MDGVVGNSSSGLAEAPSFKKGTINIGDRQQGRLQAASVINCQPFRKSIESALSELYSADFQARLTQVKNPYGEGGASALVVKTIKNFEIEGIVKKSFYNFPLNNSGYSIEFN